MGVQLDGTSNQNIKWTTPGASIIGLTQKTIFTWFYYTAVPVTSFGTIWAIVRSASPHETTVLLHPSSHLQKLAFTALWSTADGAWRTTSDQFTAGNLYQAAVTYDGGSTSNDPVIYINGASVAVTEITAPTGTYQVGSVSDLYIGTPLTPPNSNILSLCYYNRILSAVEIAEAYATRKAIPSLRGLVWAPVLWGASGLQTFDGATLTSSNKIRDLLSGIEGTPNNSPVGRGDTYLKVR